MQIKLVSSLEKAFLDDDISKKVEITKGSCLKNESYAFCALYKIEGIGWNTYLKLRIKSELEEYLTVSRIRHVPVAMPVVKGLDDEDYLRKNPGLYPDLLQPICNGERLPLTYNLESLFIEVDTKGKVESGVYKIEVGFEDMQGEILATKTFELEIIGADLGEQKLVFSQWFYPDCLKNYYGTESFDEKHWSIIESYLTTAAKRGINMILTPVFTPPLDTYVGGERQTTQLIDVKVTNGEYSFGFEKLGRWVDLCDKVGIKHFEISHLFTQWGAAHAPKVIAEVDGQERKIFGWETNAHGKEYTEFLQAVIPQMLSFLETKNRANERCWFHVSDEPAENHLESYSAARKVVESLVGDRPIIDAASEYEFYEKGVVTIPIPSNDRVEEFISKEVDNLWTYYCCTQAVEVSNRFISMPSYRNRIIGMQLYKHNIKGFLHWGYNFYNNQYSYAPINPFMCTDGDYFAQAGDAFSVYPAQNGTPLESLRLVVFHHALQDIRALELCEKLIGREKTLELLQQDIDPITFKKYPRSAEWLTAARERINTAVKNAIKN